MNLFRRGYWSKFLCLLLILIQLALIGIAAYSFLTDAISSQYGLLYFGVAYALSAASLIIITYTTTEDEYKLSWALLVGVLPVAGPILYFIFANKKTTTRQSNRIKKHHDSFHHEKTSPDVKAKFLESYGAKGAVAGYAEKIGLACLYQDTSLKYYSTGQDAYPDIIESLKNAKHYIFIESFIITKGIMWDEMLSIMAQKAKEGLDVRLSYDDFGSIGCLPRGYDKKLRKMGINARVFNKIKPFLMVKMNNRDHRKMIIVDGHTAFTGGVNIADEYINKNPRFGYWKDNQIKLVGKGVYGLTRLFLSNWIASYDEQIPDYRDYVPDKYIAEIGGFPKSDGFVQPYGDLPFDYENVGENIYLSILSTSTRYCYITTPYLILDKRLAKTLKVMAASGVDVRIITPGIPDKKLAYHMTRSNYGNLLYSGVKIYEYVPGFIHQKMFISDDAVATAGTVNLDYRSLYLHMECGTIMYGSSCIQDMKKDYLESVSHSKEITYRDWEKMAKKNGFLWMILKLASVLF